MFANLWYSTWMLLMMINKNVNVWSRLKLNNNKSARIRVSESFAHSVRFLAKHTAAAAVEKHFGASRSERHLLLTNQKKNQWLMTRQASQSPLLVLSITLIPVTKFIIQNKRNSIAYTTSKITKLTICFFSVKQIIRHHLTGKQLVAFCNKRWGAVWRAKVVSEAGERGGRCREAIRRGTSRGGTKRRLT